MIRVERSPIPPASLAVEANKINGSYRQPDVIKQLADDFHEKCYICEIKPVQDPQVEHRLPHHNRTILKRVFDWNSLFYSCSHCNSVKNSPKFEEAIIDCCSRDPEDVLNYYLLGSQVKVSVKDPTDREALLTAELIEEVFNTQSTGIRTEAGQVRLKELQTVMNTLYIQLDRYRKKPNNVRTIKTLCGLLDRTGKFSGFARSYVRRLGWQDLIRLADK